jgi:CBS domain-containing protein
MKVSEIMTMNPSTAATESTIEEIATLMKEADVGAIPILDDDSDLAGIITDRDIVVRCIAEGRDAAECKAEDILQMQAEAGLQTADPEMDVREAAQIMAQFQIRRLPVMEGDRLVGMVSLGDLAVKSGDEQLSGEALEEISEGVKQRSARQAAKPPKSQKRTDEGLKSVSSSRKQGIASHSAREENARQSKVVPMRKDNRVRNKHVTPSASRKKAS